MRAGYVLHGVRKHNLNKQKPEKNMIAKRETGKCQPRKKLISLKATRTKLHSHIKKRYFFP
jgi:hypothetical protein